MRQIKRKGDRKYFIIPVYSSSSEASD